jgi:ADP-heptose:LPS heptosyltransferase
MDSIRQIVVFRALVLGDLLCATPALRALRAGCPAARITLVGLPWAAELVERLDSVDDFIEFPGHPGLPERRCDLRELPTFLARVQRLRADLALQLHGSGSIVNPLVKCFGARRTAGFFDAHAWRSTDDGDLFVPWLEHGHEIERLLRLTDALGLPRRGMHIDFPLVDADRAALRKAWSGIDRARPYVCVHPGAQLPSRRWPPERFAAVADAIATAGRTVVLTGAASEADVVDAVRRAMRRPAVDLAGRTSLWTLGALLQDAERLVSNDTGVSHVAAALGVPSVVVSSGADVSRWAPLDHGRHHVLWADMPCRPCSHRECPTGHECATAIESGEVVRQLDFHDTSERSVL